MIGHPGNHNQHYRTHAEIGVNPCVSRSAADFRPSTAAPRRSGGRFDPGAPPVASTGSGHRVKPIPIPCCHVGVLSYLHVNKTACECAGGWGGVATGAGAGIGGWASRVGDRGRAGRGVGGECGSSWGALHGGGAGHGEDAGARGVAESGAGGNRCASGAHLPAVWASGGRAQRHAAGVRADGLFLRAVPGWGRVAVGEAA